MDEFIDIGAVNELPTGRAKVVAIGDRKIALYHTTEGFFASDNSCPHRGGPLGEGDLFGNQIVCPWHLWCFDVATGVCIEDPDVAIVRHQVRLAADRILVKLSPLGETSDLL